MVIHHPVNPPTVRGREAATFSWQTRAPRLREAKLLAPGHTACKCQSEDWALGRTRAVGPLKLPAQQQLLLKGVFLTCHPLFQQIPRPTGKQSLGVRVPNPRSPR